MRGHDGEEPWRRFEEDVRALWVKIIHMSLKNRSAYSSSAPNALPVFGLTKCCIAQAAQVTVS